MNTITTLQSFVHAHPLPLLLSVGMLTILGFFFGKTMRFIRLPSIIGFMIIGVILGPSLVNVLDETAQRHLSFITEICLGFVAFSIGLELHVKTIKQQGTGIILIILFESFLAFAAVAAGLYFLTGNLPLALIFGAIAPASAPAGTVAIIQEYKAKGKLTNALYAVVGFDDGLGIIIFGFASAIAKSLLARENGGAVEGIWQLISPPLVEIGLSFAAGICIAFLFNLLSRRIRGNRDLFILTFGLILITSGLSIVFHLSLILTNMVVGLVFVNTMPRSIVKKIGDKVTDFMPLLFILFFILAGANLHIASLPALGMIGIVYIAARSFGLIIGSKLGAVLGRSEPNIRKYLGLGILSQAGVAIGLSLIVKQEFSMLGEAGNTIAAAVITTVTGTCIFFEIIGPILTKVGLEKAGEISRT